MVTMRRMVDASGPDYYPTPGWGTRALLHYEKFDGRICEPCCGDGAMAKVLSAAGYDVDASDIYDRGFGAVASVFDVAGPVDNLVTNPPFNIAEQVIQHALLISRRKVAIFLRTAFVESVSRYDNIFSKTPPSRLLFFSKRISLYPAGNKVKGGGTTSYAWFVWDKASYPETRAIWIDPRFERGAA